MGGRCFIVVTLCLPTIVCCVFCVCDLYVFCVLCCVHAHVFCVLCVCVVCGGVGVGVDHRCPVVINCTQGAVL